MNGVDNMLYMQSINANDGSQQLMVTFGVETDVNIDQVNVQNRMAQAQPNLPTDVTLRNQIESPPGCPCSSFHFLAQSNSRFIVPGQLRKYQYYRRPLSRARRRRSEAVRGSDYAMRIWVRPDVHPNWVSAFPILSTQSNSRAT